MIEILTHIRTYITLGDVLSPTASPSKVKENIPTAQPTKSSPPTKFPTMAPSKGSDLCYANKRLIIETGASGMSNRLYAIVSATILAALTQRVLEVKWVQDKGCGVKFTDLFVPYKTGDRLVNSENEEADSKGIFFFLISLLHF